MPHFNRHFKRQATPDAGSGDGLGGAFTITGGDTAAATGNLILSTGAPTQAIPTEAIPTLAAGFTLTTSDTSAPTSTAEPTASQTPSQAISGSSSLSTGAVVAACVGAFVGLAILICVFIWWTRHNTTKRSGGIPRSPMSENRNARGEVDQQKTRSGLWNKLDDGRGGRLEEMPAEDEDEKNFSMFKKSRTMSMRTTRTAKALEEHGIDMPPLTKYHPDLAQQLAQPERPFAQRQESGVSWDGETVGDDSFLSLRSVRIESGTMSPTGIAKMTPPAIAHIHRWESAEVLTLEDSTTANATTSTAAEAASENPFADVSVERRRSGANPFFGAGEVHRSTSRRSRSSSRGPSRNASKARRSPSRSRVMSSGSEIDPFADLPGSSEAARELPPFSHSFHAHTESSLSSGVTSEHAMRSLIAALDLTQEEVEERLRVVSMQPTLDSRYSSVLSGMDDDISQFPKAPGAPSAQFTSHQ